MIIAKKKKKKNSLEVLTVMTKMSVMEVIHLKVILNWISTEDFIKDY